MYWNINLVRKGSVWISMRRIEQLARAFAFSRFSRLWRDKTILERETISYNNIPLLKMFELLNVSCNAYSPKDFSFRSIFAISQYKKSWKKQMRVLIILFFAVMSTRCFFVLKQWYSTTFWITFFHNLFLFST